MKLTEVQYRILNAVLLRADQSEEAIARALGVRAHTVRRAFSLFFQSKIFRRRSVYINPHALGLSHYVVQFSLPAAGQRGHLKFLEVLCAAEEVVAVIELSGEAQVEVRMYARNAQHL